jgi:transcriptional regulator with XRE-family HTH domain
MSCQDYILFSEVNIMQFDYYKPFNQTIKELRAYNGLTQTQVASNCSITERQYQRLEAGDSKPTYDNLVSIAKFYNVSIDFLVGRTNNPHVNQ